MVMKCSMSDMSDDKLVWNTMARMKGKNLRKRTKNVLKLMIDIGILK